MVFSELYSAYYNVIAKIITEILNGTVDNSVVLKIIEENAFEESVLNILPALREERWQVITKNYKTPIKNVPTMPLTTLQKRWLKAILLDDRIKLFDISVTGLEDIAPLFTKNDYVVYDKYLDGDNFTDVNYISKFKLLLNACRNKLPVEVEMVNRKGSVVNSVFIPEKIEFSSKDDKFRVITGGKKYVYSINIARIIKCSLFKGEFKPKRVTRKIKRDYITILVKNERNALERTMLHFAHFEKRVEKLDGDVYKVTIYYDSDLTSEMVIRVLSFGPLIEVVEPIDFRNLIIEKLKKQLSCGLK